MVHNDRMNKNIPFNLLLIWFVLSTLIFVSCEDNDELAEKDQDPIANVDTVRFGDLTTLFENVLALKRARGGGDVKL